MLILNRRHGEAILLDGGIRIIILGSDRRGARIGIEAPEEVRIQREELVSETAAENRRANAPARGAEWAARLSPRIEPR